MLGTKKMQERRHSATVEEGGSMVRINLLKVHDDQIRMEGKLDRIDEKLEAICTQKAVCEERFKAVEDRLRDMRHKDDRHCN